MGLRERTLRAAAESPSEGASRNHADEKWDMR